MTIMLDENNTFKAWAATGKGLPLVEKELKLKTWDEDSIDLDITHCGLCGTDCHILNESWGPTDFVDCCVMGHEIAGIVTRVGENVTHLSVGDRAGAGAQCFSCLACPNCLAGLENLCYQGPTMTFNSRWPIGDKTYGGFANKWRGDRRFVHKIPDNMTNEDASTFFCAGGSVYTPMVRWGVQSGSVVGVLGMGGLGHYTVLFAKAMGAKVVALSRGEKKRDVSMELGCDDYVNSDDPKDLARMIKSLTHIVCTGYSEDFKWEPFVLSLKANGVFILVGAQEYNLPPVSPVLFSGCQVSFAGSMACSSAEMKEMLEFASKHQLKPWIKKYHMKEINQALKDFDAGFPRFRFVLEN